MRICNGQIRCSIENFFVQMLPSAVTRFYFPTNGRPSIEFLTQNSQSIYKVINHIFCDGKIILYNCRQNSKPREQWRNLSWDCINPGSTSVNSTWNDKSSDFWLMEVHGWMLIQQHFSQFPSKSPQISHHSQHLPWKLLPDLKGLVDEYV